MSGAVAPGAPGHGEGGAPDRPSPFFLRHLATLRQAAERGPLADVACGRGRHLLAAAAAGLPGIGLDRSREALRALAARIRADRIPALAVRCDLEAGAPPPVAEGRFGAVLVFRYLFRPLCPWLVRLLAPGGVLLYETFTEEQARVPHGPRNPAFLLRPGELPTLFPELEVLDYREGRFGDDRPWYLASLAARRPSGSPAASAEPPRGR